jgi:hypothetical protein
LIFAVQSLSDLANLPIAFWSSPQISHYSRAVRERARGSGLGRRLVARRLVARRLVARRPSPVARRSSPRAFFTKHIWPIMGDFPDRFSRGTSFDHLKRIVKHFGDFGIVEAFPYSTVDIYE